MGNICPRFRKRRLEQPTIQILTNPECRTHETFISFKLYKHKMSIDSEGVIITYLGNYQSLTQHPLIKSFKLKSMDKLKIAYQKEVPETTSVGTTFMLDNPYDQIDIDGFILSNYPLWGEQRKDQELYQILQRSLQISQSFDQRSVSLAYFQHHLGIPLNVGTRVIIGTLLQKHRSRGVKYTILFQDEQTMEYCLKYASEFSGEISTTSVTTQY